MVCPTVFGSDENILRGIDETSRQVPRLSGLERRISLTFSSSMCRDKVLERGESFLEVGFDRELDRFPGRGGDESFHSAELCQISPVTSGSRIDHVVDRIFWCEVRFHDLLDFGFDFAPYFDGLFVSFFFGQESIPEFLLDFLDFCLSFLNEDVFHIGDDHIVLRDCESRDGCILEPDIFDLIWEESGCFGSEDEEAASECFLQNSLGKGFIDISEFCRDDLIEEESSIGGRDNFVVYTEFDRCVEGDNTIFIGVHRIVSWGIGESCLSCVHTGEIVTPEDHILFWHHNRLTIGWIEHILRCDHELGSLELCFIGEWEVDGHLIPIEIGIKGRTTEWVELDRLPFDENRLESLDTETVKCWCTI
ncbi:MAG: hypothetical protein ACD_78C00261G0001, partial [uncultured bacterium (gcode 4)]